MKKGKKLFHLQLKDGFGNPSTLIAWLTEEESIKYVYYTGWGDSGTSLSKNNIQFYTLTPEGNKKWNDRMSLPIMNEPEETVESFTKRVINQLNNSTEKVVKEIPVKVVFV